MQEITRHTHTLPTFTAKVFVILTSAMYQKVLLYLVNDEFIQLVVFLRKVLKLVTLSIECLKISKNRRRYQTTNLPHELYIRETQVCMYLYDFYMTFTASQQHYILKLCISFNLKYKNL